MYNALVKYTGRTLALVSTYLHLDVCTLVRADTSKRDNKKAFLITKLRTDQIHNPACREFARL